MDNVPVPLELWRNVSSYLELPDLLRLQCVHRDLPPFRATCTRACQHTLSHFPPGIAQLHLRKASYADSTWDAFFRTSPTTALTDLSVHHANIPYPALLYLPRFVHLRSLQLTRCLQDTAAVGCSLDFLDALPGCLQHLVLRDNHLSVTTSQVHRLVHKLQHLDLSYNVLVHDVQTFPPIRSRCRVLKLDGVYFGKALLTTFLHAIQFPVLQELYLVRCAEDIAMCLTGVDLRSLTTLAIHRDRDVRSLLPSLPHLQHWSAGRRWSYAELPQPLHCTIDVGLTDVKSPAAAVPINIVRLVLECPVKNAAAFLVHHCPRLEYLDTSSWSSSHTYRLLRDLFALKGRLPVKYWKTSYLQAAAADAYYLYVGECPNIDRIHHVVPSHAWVFASAFTPPAHFFRSVVHLHLAHTFMQPDVCRELFTWLYDGSFQNLATLDLSGNSSLDDAVFKTFRLPSSYRNFRLAYHDTAATPWSLFDVLGAHKPRTFSSISAMCVDDSLVQIKSVLYVIGHGHVRCLPSQLALPDEVHTQIPNYIVQQLNQHCCELVAIF